MNVKKKLTLATIALILLGTSQISFAQQEGFIGEVRFFAGNFAPRGWALCDGQLLAISQNQALFSILGTTYGGDGRTTFALPDLRSRVVMHPGNGPGLSSRRLGEKGGVEAVTLTESQIPAHKHTAKMRGDANNGTTTTPAGGALGIKNRTEIYTAGPASVDMASDTVKVDNTGGGQAHTNVQPFQALNCIIATQGTFPSRN